MAPTQQEVRHSEAGRQDRIGSSSARSSHRNGHQVPGRPVGTCRMQDVVLVPFELTWLYGGKEDADVDGLDVDDLPQDDNLEQLDVTVFEDGAITTLQEASNCVVEHEGNAEQPIVSTSHHGTTTSPDRLVVQSRTETIKEKDTTEAGTRAFEDGTTTIPEEIKRVCQVIRSCKTHTNKLPLRVELRKALPAHFNAYNMTLKKGSSLLQYYGDTRLFSEKEWMYLDKHQKR